MTSTPSDDALNAAWNDLVEGRDDPAGAGTGQLDPADAALLRFLHGTADATRPDPAFRDGLWAELSRRSPIAAPMFEPTPDSRTPVMANRPAQRIAPPAHRWTSPVATIAAALVIALVGYGALSLSGATPGGLNLNPNDVPNASAQGQSQDLTGNPVVGTWVIWANAFSESNTITQSITFEPDGTLITQFSLAKAGTTPGTWSADGDGRIFYRFTALFDGESLNETFTTDSPFIPQLIQVSGSFRLSSDQTTWEDEQNSSVLLSIDQSGNPFRVSEPATDDDLPPLYSVNTRSPERIEDIIERSPEMTAEQQEALNSSGADTTSSQQTPNVTNTPPTPTSQVTATLLPTSTTVPSPSPIPYSQSHRG